MAQVTYRFFQIYPPVSPLYKMRPLREIGGGMCLCFLFGEVMDDSNEFSLFVKIRFETFDRGMSCCTVDSFVDHLLSVEDSLP